jgi:hypothetical protein
MSNEYFARQALKELGITRANRSNAEYQALIDAYMRADEANQKLEDEAELAEAQAKWDREHGSGVEDSAIPDKPTLDKPIPPRPVLPSILRPVVLPKPRSDGRPHGSSKSCLMPVLRGEGVLEKQVRVGKPGRPRIIATWMPDVAATTADGTTLPEALRIHGVELDATQLRALYRNKAFKEMRIEARENYLMDGLGATLESLADNLS